MNKVVIRICLRLTLSLKIEIEDGESKKLEGATAPREKHKNKLLSWSINPYSGRFFKVVLVRGRGPARPRPC